MRVVLLLTMAAGLLATSCMDPLNNYKDCVKIEQARCQLRDNCLPGFDKATCFAYYEEFCRTRKMNGPGSDNLTDEMVQACVDAIVQVPCDWINPETEPYFPDETELLPECDFLHKNPADGGSSDGGGQDGGDDDAGGDSGPESIPDQSE